MTSKHDLKVFCLNDYEWWIGESLEAVKAHYADNVTHEPQESAYEVSDEQLDSTRYYTGEDYSEAGPSISFREALAIEAAKDDRSPRFFAALDV